VTGNPFNGNTKKTINNPVPNNNIMFQPSQGGHPNSNSKGAISTITINSTIVNNNPNKENNNYTNYEANIYNLLNKSGKGNTVTATNTSNNFNNNQTININEVKPSTTTISLNLQSSRNNNYQAQVNPFNYSKSFMKQPEEEEDLQTLTVKHEKLINRILIEEESYIDNHKCHVTDMYDILQKVKMLNNPLGMESYR
jgi:hypothetical protein